MAANGDEAITLNQLKQFDSSGGVNIWPIGSIYMSVSPTDPATLFGGTWERIQGRFLFAADSKHAAGSTGGEETHKLTESEMPSHNHGIPAAMRPSGSNLGTRAEGWGSRRLER